MASADALKTSFDDDASTLATNDDVNQARARLDRTVKLLAWALDLRELLWFGIVDLDDATDQVAAWFAILLANGGEVPSESSLYRLSKSAAR